jgi:hypothetical protein
MKSGKIFSFGMAITVIACGMLITACFSLPKADFNAFMDYSVPASEHAVLSVGDDLNVSSIDGEVGVITNGKETQLMLSPGEHKLFVSYFSASVTSNTWGSTTTYTTTSRRSDMVELSNDFLPGHFYWIAYGVSGDNITFKLIDETDPAVYEKKRDQNAARKRIDAAKKMLPAAASEKIAVSTEPTKFEGDWKGSTGVFQFKGNTYTLISSTGGNTVITKGSFEFSDKQLKLTPRLNKKVTLKWDYSFNPDGTLTLEILRTRQVLTKEQY